MKLTSRDVAILQFINEFGFCEIPQINERFALRKPRNYQIVNKLIRHNLLQHERIFYRRHGLFRLTQAGSRFTPLPPLHRVPLANYHHDLALLNLYLKLRIFYPGATWISERKLKHDKYKLGVGQQGHLPDGILIFPDGKQVAIEVELSCKSKQRLEAILKTYAAQFSLQEVWYGSVKKIFQFTDFITFLFISSPAWLAKEQRDSLQRQQAPPDHDASVNIKSPILLFNFLSDSTIVLQRRGCGLG